jgi:hypothetical protein
MVATFKKESGHLLARWEGKKNLHRFTRAVRTRVEPAIDETGARRYAALSLHSTGERFTHCGCGRAERIGVRSMFQTRLWLAAPLLILVSASGCCNWCHRWCPQQAQPVQVMPANYSVPVAPVAPANCVPCVPCCPTPVGTLKQPVPVYPTSQANSWQRSYYTAGDSCVCY